MKKIALMIVAHAFALSAVEALGSEFTPDDSGNVEGSWNFGRDGNCCRIITSGDPGLCAAPESRGPCAISATESGMTN